MPSASNSLVDRDACHECPHHRMRGSGCEVVEGSTAIPLDDFLARETCYLVVRLASFAARCVAHRPRLGLETSDLVQEAVAQLLSNTERRAGGFATGLRPFLAYLKRTVWTCAISHERRELGRLRCGSCARYAPHSRICLAPRHPWTSASLAPSQDPRLLEPACECFAALRLTEALPAEFPVQASKDNDESAPLEELRNALLELATANPRAALVLRGRCLEGRSYADLAALGVSVRTMKRDFAEGMAFLRQRLHLHRPARNAIFESAKEIPLPLLKSKDVSLPQT